MKRLSMTFMLLLTMLISICADVKVVFTGDGITDGAWGRSKGVAKPVSERNYGDLNHHLGDGYVFLCGAWYQSQYPTLGINIQNRGIIGNTLDDLSARWQDDILSLNPDVISVLIGSQDIDNYIGTDMSESFNFDAWQEKYRTMLTAARTANANVKLVLCAPYCGAIASNYTTRKDLLMQLATKVQALATEFSAVYVPFNEIAEVEPTAGNFFWDGTLPTAAGQYEMFKKWVSIADGYVIGNTAPMTIGPAKAQNSNGKRRILYIGDSITDAGWGLAGGSALNTNQRDLTALDHIMGHGYAMLCAGWYQTVYPEANYEVINRGISGNTLANLANRWETDVIANSPDVLSILIGTNDIDQWLKGNKTTPFDYDAWEAQYRTLINRVKADNPLVQIALGTPFVGSRSSDYETRSAMVAELASRVRTIATSMECTLIPYDELFAELTSNQPNTAYWIWDGIHPSPAGHYKMQQLWLQEAGALVFADAMPEQSTELTTGGQFMDLLLPMEGSIAATESDWGTAAGEETNPRYAGTWAGTLGRWKDNGIEDTEHSYWGGNIIKGDDGKYHIYVSGWPESTARGHMAWSSASRVYHVISDNVWGPYTYVSDIGAGHNSEIYKTGDTYIIYHIEPLGYYKSTSLGDTWESGEYTFDLRDRALIAGENRETSLSNCSFAKRDDGSFIMIDRGGGIWVSRDGLTDPWHQISTSSVYLNSTVTNRGTLEDPVIWRDHLQYHMIVNDWQARYAYYYRSKDGLHWVMESGKAYTGQDPFAKHSDGTVEQWHKYERPRVYQDELGRAIRMNFAVIDCVKQSDLGSDTHSSKNINMPVTRQLLLEVQGNTPINSSTTSIRVLVKAEDGFNPRTDLDLTSLKFGAHNKVNFGNGLSYSSSENSGTSDLIITFTGVAGQSGITEDEWAPKMLGLMTNGSVAFGYAKMPGVDYKPAMLSAVTPTISTDGTVQSVSITNYGEQAATATTVRIYAPDGTTLLAHGTTSALAAYGSETVNLTKDAAAGAGYKSIIVRFYDGETMLNEEKIALTAINAAQTALQNVIDEAEELYNDSKLTNGKPALLEAINAAKDVVGCYNAPALTEQQTTLNAALNTYKYANASPTNGLAITILNATMEDLSEWTLTRKDADNAPGWKTNTNGASYEGFEGNFMEYWVSQASALGYANRAYQLLTNMPAGRYRLRANIIATRQNSNDAVTGIALYANDHTTACATARDGTPQEFMVEINMAEEGTLEIGLDIAASTTANWVAWDNVTLKYFGTQEGDIVEEEVEPLSFEQSKVFYIKWYDHGNYTKLYWQSPKFDTSGNNTIHRTSNKSEAAQFIIRSATTEGQFYLYDVVSQQYVVPSGNSNNGTAWTWSATTLGKTVITESGDAFTISSTVGGYANAYANDNNDADVRNYGGGSKWAIEEAGENIAIFGISPKAVYRLTHHNTNRYRYLASEPDGNSNLLTTNTDSEKGEYSLLPISGQEGYYYLYNKDGYFVTPSTGNWTLSKTTPAAVKIEINTEYMEDYLSSHSTTNITFMLGEANQHANAQRINNVELVKAYSDHPLDKGNNWVLEPIADATAAISLNAVTSNIDNLIASAIAEDIDLTYSISAAALGYQTFAADCALDFTNATVKAYIAKNVNDGMVFLQQVTKVPAGTGLLLEGTDAEAIPVLTTNDADDVSDNLMHAGDGSTISKEDGYDKYVLAADDNNTTVSFYLINNTSATIAKGKSYLKVPGQQSNNARQLTFSFWGDVTGIKSVNNPPLTDNTFYNIAGQRVANPTHGLYIRNGKKIYIK